MVEKKEKIRNSKYICTDCDVSFELLSWSGKDIRKKHCPMCGDYVSVRTLKLKTINDDIWSDEELEYLDRYIAGEVTNYSLAFRFGRSIKAVNSKAWKRRKDLGIPCRMKPPWTDEDKEYADWCINGEITLEDLAAKVGRNYESVRCFVSRRRKQQNKNRG